MFTNLQFPRKLILRGLMFMEPHLLQTQDALILKLLGQEDALTGVMLAQMAQEQDANRLQTQVILTYQLLFREDGLASAVMQRAAISTQKDYAFLALAGAQE